MLGNSTRVISNSFSALSQCVCSEKTKNAIVVGSKIAVVATTVAVTLVAAAAFAYVSVPFFVSGGPLLLASTVALIKTGTISIGLGLGAVKLMAGLTLAATAVGLACSSVIYNYDAFKDPADGCGRMYKRTHKDIMDCVTYVAESVLSGGACGFTGAITGAMIVPAVAAIPVGLAGVAFMLYIAARVS